MGTPFRSRTLPFKIFYRCYFCPLWSLLKNFWNNFFSHWLFVLLFSLFHYSSCNWVVYYTYNIYALLPKISSPPPFFGLWIPKGELTIGPQLMVLNTSYTHSLLSLCLLSSPVFLFLSELATLSSRLLFWTWTKFRLLVLASGFIIFSIWF